MRISDWSSDVCSSDLGIINSGPEASRLLRELAALIGAPVTSTLMGLGALPASSEQWLGMLGMHGTFEANKIGRASGRGRVCPYVEIAVVGVSITKKNTE